MARNYYDRFGTMWVCDKCGFADPYKQRVIQHEREHVKDRTCPVCKKVWPSVEDMLLHKKLYH